MVRLERVKRSITICLVMMPMVSHIYFSDVMSIFFSFFRSNIAKSKNTLCSLKASIKFLTFSHWNRFKRSSNIPKQQGKIDLRPYMNERINLWKCFSFCGFHFTTCDIFAGRMSDYYRLGLTYLDSKLSRFHCESASPKL